MIKLPSRSRIMLFGLAGLLGLFVVVGLWRFLAVGGRLVVVKPQGLFYNIGQWFVARGTFFVRQSQLLREQETMRIQLARALQDQASVVALQQENTELRELLNFRERVERELIVASVIARVPDRRHVAIINRGRSAGLIPGLAVVTNDGLVVGKLLEVRDETSLVLTILDSQTRFAAMVADGEQTSGIVTGEHDLVVKMQMIPQNEAVNAGDVIVTSGSEDGVPRGLVIGQVDRVTFQPGDLFQEAIITQPLDYRKLLLVAVVLP